ncbi:MAG TPA: hypothetical protein PKH77_16425 [Anaerolineae bacterium]|nr:hypothetical protein [Anaerolineae bacterium]
MKTTVSYDPERVLATEESKLKSKLRDKQSLKEYAVAILIAIAYYVIASFFGEDSSVTGAITWMMLWILLCQITDLERKNAALERKLNELEKSLECEH